MTELHRLEGYEEAVKAVRASTSPRTAFMAKLEQFVAGTQYVGLPDYFTSDVPLWERAPCIVDATVKTAIDSNVDLILGEGRFPIVTCRPAEDDSDLDESLLDEDESGLLDRLIPLLYRQVRFESVCREVLAAGQASGTGVSIFGLRNGKLFADTTRARWCTPTFGSDGSLEALEISYPYIEETTVEKSGKRMAQAKLYQRVITSMTDITFMPMRIDADGRPQDEWKPDPAQTHEHGFGFVPAIWYPFMRGCEMVSRIDGHAIHENVLDEIRAHDMALSMRHRAALFAGDPQWTEIGVEPGHNPSADGREAMVPATARGGAPSADNPITAHFTNAPTLTKRRKKSPGQVWQYPNADTKVQLHTLPADALKALDEHARDLRTKITEAIGVVNLDPDNMKFAAAMSGTALRILKGRQTDKCDQYRGDFGDHYLKPATSMLLRIAYHCSRMPAGYARIQGLTKLAPILSKFSVEDTVPDVA